ncbi:hypothetical protein BD289DRAFT_426308 [Coniella lustricola]|uniref:Structure-specific endonuclease subunit SLX4 n=1 Tax=Coniella lustricola TaxID=2025994 RepID=A0A2T3AG96_9PEZI|nr:hypothetical protein BD289DRAFT_426308 [Coniella lustricola]
MLQVLRCSSQSRNLSLSASCCSTLLRCVRRTHHTCFSQGASPTMPDYRAQSPQPAVPPAALDHFTMLSSSPLPDILDLGVRKPKTAVLRSGSAAEPIPPLANATFMSASALLRSARTLGGDHVSDPIDEPEPPTTKQQQKKKKATSVNRARKPAEKKQANSRAPKQAAKKSIVLSSDGEDVDNSARRPCSTAANAGACTDDVTKENDSEHTPWKAKPWKKYRAPDDPSHVAGREKAGEPSAASPGTRESEVTINLGMTSNQTLDEPDIVGPPKAKPKRLRARTPEPVNLDAAIPRRLDWTPPRPAPAVLPTTNTLIDGLADDVPPSSQSTSPAENSVFKTLQQTYAHNAVKDKFNLLHKPHAEVLGKRKRIEMVAINHNPQHVEIARKPSPVKEKVPKKKPRTITDLAMAPYLAQAAESVEEAPQGGSLVNYFPVEDDAQEPSKPEPVGTQGKAAKVTKSKKKAVPKKPTLLSPRTAMKQSAAQDFVFGTFSQLAREKSPTLLRDLHEALKASTISNELEEDRFAGFNDVAGSNKRGKGLWSVSARDEDGEMVNVEVIDLVGSPTIFPEDDSILDPWTQLPPEPATLQLKASDSSIVAVEGDTTSHSAHSHSRLPGPGLISSAMQKKNTANTLATVSPIPSTPQSFFMVTDLLEYEMPPPSNQEQSLEESKQSPKRASTTSPQKPRPKYESFTDAKLAKEISKFGFKAVRTRNAMISLLDQCWRSKNQLLGQTAAFSTSSAHDTPSKRKDTVLKTSAAASASPAKKPRGQPKKAKTVYDIADEEEEDKTSSRASAEKKADAAAIPKKRGRPRKDTAAPEKDAAAVQASPKPKPKTKPRPKARAATPPYKKEARTTPEIRDSDLDSNIGMLSPLSEELFSPANRDASLVGDDMELSVNASASNEQSALFQLITKAVVSAPRTSDPSQPSWHEKMLMYDPIVLEDLAVWLNTGQLTRVGHDEEVSPLEVKKWCESRSICCIWKATYRGKERKRV